MELKFRLKVHKCKCSNCDTITLLERDDWIKEKMFSCPVCEKTLEVMEDITVVEEKQ